jgi:hypothetical protein
MCIKLWPEEGEAAFEKDTGSTRQRNDLFLLVFPLNNLHPPFLALLELFQLQFQPPGNDDD